MKPLDINWSQSPKDVWCEYTYYTLNIRTSNSVAALLEQLKEDFQLEMCSCFDGPDAVELREVSYSTNECLTCKKPFIETEVFARMVQNLSWRKKLRLPTY